MRSSGRRHIHPCLSLRYSTARHIRGVVIEGFDMSDIGNVLVLKDEVTDCINIFYISPLDVGYFIASPPLGTILVGGPFPALVGGYSRNTKSPPSQAPPQLLSHYYY